MEKKLSLDTTSKYFSDRMVMLVGLGNGRPDHLTLEAWSHLSKLRKVYVRTSSEVMSQILQLVVSIEGFDEYFASAESARAANERIVTRLLKEAQDGLVTLAVPGHPLVGDALCDELIRRGPQEGVAIKVLDGFSLVEYARQALGAGMPSEFAVLDALTLAGMHMPPFPPSQAVLVTNLSTPSVAGLVRRALSGVYPETFTVRLVHYVGLREEALEETALGQIDQSAHLGPFSMLYLPPLAVDAALEAFQDVVARLRAPDGCPWDRKQTHQTLRPNLLEETYETLEALDSGDPAKMSEEFGDLLLQIVLHAQIASEAGEYTLADVIQGIHQKIVRRHPHVFGEVQVEDVSGVLRNWEKLKAEEREAAGQDERGLLDSIPKALAALTQAQEYQDRAARVGFDWDDVGPVRAKVLEELREVDEAADASSRARELGDLLFAVVNLARWYKADAESMLRETNQRFRRRFSYIEKTAKTMGRDLNDMTLAEMDVLWDEAKRME